MLEVDLKAERQGAGGGQRGERALRATTAQVREQPLAHRPGRNSGSFWRSDWAMIRRLPGSPCRIAEANERACSSVMCGGSGGTSGSQTTSSTVGRSLASA